jgi:hypothetical protein
MRRPGVIEAGEGDDVIANEGTIQGVAKADTTSVGVSVGVGIAKQGLAAGVGLSDTSTGARALSVGIDGGAGEDRIVNRGAINLGLESGFGSVANADAVSVGRDGSRRLAGPCGSGGPVQIQRDGHRRDHGNHRGRGPRQNPQFRHDRRRAKADVDSTNVAVDGNNRQGKAWPAARRCPTPRPWRRQRPRASTGGGGTTAS